MINFLNKRRAECRRFQIAARGRSRSRAERQRVVGIAGSRTRPTERARNCLCGLPRRRRKYSCCARVACGTAFVRCHGWAVVCSARDGCDRGAQSGTQPRGGHLDFSAEARRASDLGFRHGVAFGKRLAVSEAAAMATITQSQWPPTSPVNL